MKPLQENPGIFLTGEFKIRLPGGTVEAFRPHHLSAMENNPKWIEESTLIARPIEGMTDEEWEPIVDKLGQLTLSRMMEGELPLSFGFVSHLLEIGVYPFDQSHFENGTVLNINEV